MSENSEYPTSGEAFSQKKEVDEGKKVLNEKHAGVQGAVLLDVKNPGEGAVLDKDKLLKVKENIDARKSFETQTINTDSGLERYKYWKEKHPEADTFEKQNEAWEKSANEFFDYYYDNPKEKAGERDVLTKLGMVKGGAKDVYDEYFGADNGKGEIGYFASKVANNLSYEQIEEHRELLEKIGGFYGKDSAEVAVLLAQGAKNLKDNSKAFVSAVENDPSKGLKAQETSGGNAPDLSKVRGELMEQSKLQPVPSPDVIKGQETEAATETEKKIKGMITELGTNYYDDLVTKAEQHGFDLKEFDQRENARNPVWLKKMYSDLAVASRAEWWTSITKEYKNKVEAIRGEIAKGMKDGRIGFEEIKRSEIREGDILNFISLKRDWDDASSFHDLCTYVKKDEATGHKVFGVTRFIKEDILSQNRIDRVRGINCNIKWNYEAETYKGNKYTRHDYTYRTESIKKEDQKFVDGLTVKRLVFKDKASVVEPVKTEAENVKTR